MVMKFISDGWDSWLGGMAADAAAVISTETAMLIAGNENDLDESDPLLVMKTWRTTLTTTS